MSSDKSKPLLPVDPNTPFGMDHFRVKVSPDDYRLLETGYDQQAATEVIFGKDSPAVARRRKILDDAALCILGQRTGTHGDPEDNFEEIAAMLNVRLKRKLKAPLSALDVASIGVIIKEARKISAAGELHLDNWVDGAGYNGCGGGIVLKMLEDKKSP